MSNWNSTFFQDALSPLIGVYISFRDFIIIFVCLILSFIFYVFIFILTSKANAKIEINIHIVEALWTFFPAVILVVIAVPSIKALYLSEITQTAGVTLKVMGNQWYWGYELSLGSGEGVEAYQLSKETKTSSVFRLLDVDNIIRLPFNFPIQILVSSNDVIHSWALPRAGLKIDAFPGRVNQIFSSFSMPGLVYGQCSEICGANHSFIPISLAITNLDKLV